MSYEPLCGAFIAVLLACMKKRHEFENLQSRAVCVHAESILLDESFSRSAIVYKRRLFKIVAGDMRAHEFPCILC